MSDELLKLFELRDFPKDCISVENYLKNKKIILYGAGNGLIVLNRIGIKPECVIDRRFKEITYYKGIKAYPPSDFKVTEINDKNFVVLLTVTRPEFEKEVLEYLESIGINKNQIIFSKEFYEFNLPYVPEELKNEGFNFYLKNKEKILSCINLFQDEISHIIYINFIKTHMLRKVHQLPYHPSNEEYFPKDIKLRYDTMIHCGAYTGDTIYNLKKNVGKINRLICFEPNLENFSILKNYLKTEKESIAEEIIILPLAVYKEVQILNFDSSGAASSLTEKGENIALCIALDDILINFKPTYITMDVEGAELSALQGAEHIIKRYKPDLAVSVYHYPNHIWDIPLYLNTLNLGYKFYLRNYRGFTLETILYATCSP